MFNLAPAKRRLIYVIIFELLAISVSTVLLDALATGSTSPSLPIAITISAIAVMWNYLYNTGFEAVERRLNWRERSVKIRVLHSIGFEVGIVMMTVPLMMYWYQVGLLTAVKMEAALLVFFLIFTFVFTWTFDLIFPLRSDEPSKPAEQAA